MSSKPDRCLMTGNDAVGEGAIRAGCMCYFGYPITPQNELTAYMAAHMPKHDRVFIQAESELAAINMVFGASASGVRAMTTSSSPGISLKQEGISYMAACMLPGVVVNVQRGGPGLGGIGPSQSDYFQATKGGGHGDYHILVLAPQSVQEMHDMTVEAFALSDRYRVPAMILADGRLGQMMEPVVLHRGPPPPEPEKTYALTGASGRAPRIIKSLFMKDEDLEEHNHRLQALYATICETEPRSEESGADDAEITICAWGTCARIAGGAIQRAASEGIQAKLFRPITLWPFPYRRLSELTGRHKKVLVVEMNAGQMLEDIRLGALPETDVQFKGFLGSRVPTENEILDELRRMHG